MNRFLDWITDRPAGPAQIIQFPAPGFDTFTAAATSLDDAPKGKVPVPTANAWQEDAWRYYDDLGEFRYGVDWRAEMISRVRLRAGKLRPGQDEPELQDDGPAAELIDKLIQGSAGGPDQLMHSFATQLGVPGECWLTGETIDPDTDRWQVRSADEIRKARDPQAKWDVIDDERSLGGQERWRTLPVDSLVTRVWTPHPRRFHVADSPARAARGVMRELELVNRHILALHLSRLASCGMIKIPSEVDFPVRPEFRDKYNKVTLEWMAAAQTAIQTPGSAAAAIPIPFVAAAEYLEKIEFVDFFTKADEKILDKRDSAIRRLATQLDLPAEVLLGMGDVNHWSAWQLEESGVKVHILPMVERIVYALLIGYLNPRLKAAGEYDGTDVVWYDASEITMRPDRSEQAMAAYDKLEINGTALRRETGLDEADKPTLQELEYQILLKLAQDPTQAPIALKKLTGTELEAVEGLQPEPEAQDPAESPEVSGTADPTPDTRNEAPPPPDERAAAGIAETLRFQVDRATQAKRDMRHWGSYTAINNQLVIMHPEECGQVAVPCPYGDAATPKVTPGSTGLYEVSLIDGKLRIGAKRQDSAHARSRT